MSAAFKINRPEEIAEINSTVCVGLIGRSIQLSRTPFLHEAEGAALGMRYLYRLFDTDLMQGDQSLDNILSACETAGYSGLNITFPYKQLVMDYLDDLSDAAKRVGAVNTVVFKEGKRIGENTDIWGFTESLRQHSSARDMSDVILLGAGGAGSAVANALIDLGVKKLSIFDTNLTSAEKLVNSLRAQGLKTPITIVEDLAVSAFQATGIVNATPVGMAKIPGTPLPIEYLATHMWLADIVYFPLETELLKAAKLKGCSVIPGSGMAVYQAIKSFELFSGISPDPKRMKASFESFQK